MTGARRVGAGRIAGWIALVAAACLGSAAHATTVLVLSLEQGRVQLLVNGNAVRVLREGQASRRCGASATR